MEYKQTVFLPKTDFPMRGGLPRKEPEILKDWEDLKIYQKLRQDRDGCEKYVLHDGPPYANGNLHMGTALNKILKDIINRFQSMLGKDANYVPGWDCHGLPIEWKIEEQYRKKGRDKDAVPIVEFRKECREFAQKWMDIQSIEFQRLGVCGDFENPYTTMNFEAEAIIAKEMGKFLLNGSLYRGSKPVMWSVVEKTALAEAEIEYENHKSTTIFVRFPIIETHISKLNNVSIIIWTTTPWTMPGNRAVAYSNDIEYVILGIKKIKENSLALKNEKILIAKDLIDSVVAECGIDDWKILDSIKGSELKGSILKHPLEASGYKHKVPLLSAEFVTVDQGTGFVHIAPGHGEDDFILGKSNDIEVPETVSDNGKLMSHLPLFSGMHVLRDNSKIADIMSEKGGLIGRGELIHSYPHSWRSKAPLIFRNTPQWFISMENNNLKKTALSEIEKTKFYPLAGKQRLHSMIKNRPDWCLSRQRAWGIPIPVFINKNTGEPLRDKLVVDRIVNAFKKEGSDAWFNLPPEVFLGSNYKPDDYTQIMDIADVWFDSGSTHAFVLEQRQDLKSPADLYLEGSDQHRGWFHSSLLESVGSRGKAPYKGILTHGFVLDENGRKMSKSLGNTVNPQDIIRDYGADILRLWVVGSDYYEDLRIGPEIIKHHTDHYRRLRNTLRYLLGSLNGFTDKEKISTLDMPELEKWLLHRVAILNQSIKMKTENYEMHSIYTEIHNFCSIELSSFYFDIRKDLLYCGDPHGIERRGCRTALEILFKSITSWLAPILCFTAEEAWQSWVNNKENSIHLRTHPDIPSEWIDHSLSKKWERIRLIRSIVLSSIENARNENLIKSSLQAKVLIKISENDKKLFQNIDAADLFITSGVLFIDKKIPKPEVEIEIAEGKKCARCWKILPEVFEDEGICNRCTSVLESIDG